MQSKISIALAIIVSFFVISCGEDKDPGPDLSSKITFTWTLQNPNPARYDLFVLISDSSGNVLGWKNLPSGVLVEMPYPPSGTTANVSIISHLTMQDGRIADNIATFTDIPGGDYFYSESSLPGPNATGLYKVRIKDASTYANYFTTFTSGAWNETSEGDDLLRTLGLFNDERDKVLVSIKKPGESFRYYYNQNPEDGDSIEIDDTFYNSMEEMPSFVLDFPDHKNMSYTFGGVSAQIKGTNYFWFTSNSTWDPWQVPTVNYIELPEMFDKYESWFYAIGKDGVTYISDMTADKPVQKFTQLQADLTHKGEFSTNKISIDFTGEGDVIQINGGWGAGQIGVSWDIYTTMTSKLRLNVPKFPDDLIEKLPGLALPKDKNFRDLYINDYNTPYKDYAMTRLKISSYQPITYYVAKAYLNLDDRTARIGDLSPEQRLQRHRSALQNPWVTTKP